MPFGPALQAARRLRVQFALIVAIAMAPAGVVAVIQASANIEDAIRLEEEALRKSARRVTEAERTAVLAIRERMRFAARAPGIRALGGDECDIAVERLYADDARFSGGLVLNDRGIAVCGERKGLDISDSAAYRSFSDAPRLVVGPVRQGRLSGRNMLLALAPVLSEDGRTGILALGLAADFFQGLADRPDESGEGQTRYALLDEAGTVFAQNTSRARDWLPASVEALLREDEVVEKQESRDGVDRIFYVAPMPIERMWVIAGRPQLSWSGIIFSDKGMQLVMPLLLWAIAVAVAFFVIDRLVSRHIVYLQRVAGAIGRGHLDIGQLQLEGAPYEIKCLGDALERMSARLAEREAALRANIDEKRALLLEVHHRVKNNLQMISSLMNMQLRRVTGEAERQPIQILQDRIHGLALVHQHLYAAERLDAVPLDKLVRDLVSYLRNSLCPPSASAVIEFDCEPMEASADVATPVALFVTEAVANAFKHSWRPERQGTLSVSLKASGDDGFMLAIRNDRDDPGSDSGAVSRGGACEGLGARLMEGFARQIGGTLDYDVSPKRFAVTLRAPLATRSKNFSIRQGSRRPEAEGEQPDVFETQ